MMKMNETPPRGNIISELAQTEKDPTFTKLAELSDLSRQDLEVWQANWQKIPVERRRQIISRLKYLAEENVELNFDSIFKSSLDDPDEEIRALSIEGLWEAEDTSLIRLLIKALENDVSTRVQEAAAVALGRFALLAEAGKIDSAHRLEIARSLLNVFNDEARSLGARRRALEAVAPLSPPEVKKAISAAYQSGELKLKASSIYAMRMNGDPEWLPIIINELSDSEPELRYEATSACGEIGGVTEVPRLVNLIEDEDIEVRLAAIQALGKIGGELATARLKKCLKDKSHLIRECAQQTLYEMEAVKKIVPLLEFERSDTIREYSNS